MACPAATATATSGDGATVQPCSAVLFLAHVTLFVHLFWGMVGRGSSGRIGLLADWFCLRCLRYFWGEFFEYFFFLCSFFGAVSQLGLFAAQCPHLCVCGFA